MKQLASSPALHNYQDYNFAKNQENDCIITMICEQSSCNVYIKAYLSYFQLAVKYNVF